MKRISVFIPWLLLASVALAGAPPDFQLPTLRGDTVRLSDHLGKGVLLIDFWAIYCKPCLRELPHIQKIYDEFKDRGFQVLAINVDPGANLSRVKSYIKSRKYTFPILHDQDSKVLETYNPTRTMPYSVLVDKEGNIVRIMDGYKKGDEEALRADIEKLLGAEDESEAGEEG